MKGVFYIIEPQIGFGYSQRSNAKSQMGITLGFRFATAITPNRTTWKYQGRDVFGAPDAGPVGSMMRVQIGIGDFRLMGRYGITNSCTDWQSASARRGRAGRKLSGCARVYAKTSLHGR